ncbi:MAG TPA: sulfurtransferase [Anaerolineae bacterium]|jgi:thiosulfate/3-mercaptopyruvate sulfurtransferase|nr:sulfurtransferase [Anaerolineae bacterium]
MVASKGYAYPEVLVSTEWVEEKLDKRERIRLVESNEDLLLYDTGHIPGATHVDWTRDLNDPIQRDYLTAERFAQVMEQHGIGNEMTVVFYGDKSNWWACYAFWVFKLFGHADCRIMDGGRRKWIEEGRPMTKVAPTFAPGQYVAKPRIDYRIRALREQVLSHISLEQPLIDVRSPQEYLGQLLHMPGMPQEGALRGGHIKGARNLPWSRAVNDDGTFKAAAELRELYEAEAGLTYDQNVIVYCRIGERSAHTWFVLTYLLGYLSVRNYDGSWTEWGNLVGAPIVNPSAADHS